MEKIKLIITFVAACFLLNNSYAFGVPSSCWSKVTVANKYFFDNGDKDYVYKSVQLCKSETKKVLNLSDDLKTEILYAALIINDSDLLEFFIKKNTDFLRGVNLEDRVYQKRIRPFQKTSLLHLAAIYSDKTFISKLFDLGVAGSINAKKQGGLTPLLLAAAYDKAENVKFLASKGAGLNYKDNDDNSALSYAIDNCNKELAMFLINSGANKDVTVWGEPILDSAIGCFDSAKKNKYLYDWDL